MASLRATFVPPRLGWTIGRGGRVQQLCTKVARMPVQPPKYVPVAATRPVLGVVCLPTDPWIEEEMCAMAAAVRGGAVGVRIQRLVVPGGDTLTQETYRTALNRITDAAATIGPKDVLSAISLSCTSMSMTLGRDTVAERLRAAHPNAAVTSMDECVELAVRQLGIHRVGLVSPYIPELHELAVGMLQAAGAQVTVETAFGLSTDADIATLSPTTLSEAAKSVAHHARRNGRQLDGIVLCCSAMRATGFGFIDQLEAELGMPVVTSNQAQMWRLLRLSGVSDAVPGYGALLAAVNAT